MLHQVLCGLAHSLFLHDLTHSPFDVSHAVLSSMEGTGKTMILKAFVYAVAICCDNYFLIYTDFSSADTDTIHKPDCISFSQAIIKFCYMTKLFGRDLFSVTPDGTMVAGLYWFFGFAGDEAQSLFVSTTDMRKDLYIKTVKQLHAFACGPTGAFLILTGLASNLRSHLFKASHQPGEFEEYPDFNGQLCLYYHMAALHEVKLLAQYLMKQFPMPHQHAILQTGHHSSSVQNQ